MSSIKCDVSRCHEESVSGGMGWCETGYWQLCRKHHSLASLKRHQPKMNRVAVGREGNRDEDGCLPEVTP